MFRMFSVVLIVGLYAFSVVAADAPLPDFKTMGSRIAVVETDVKQLKDDIASLKSEIAALKSTKAASLVTTATVKTCPVGICKDCQCADPSKCPQGCPSANNLTSGVTYQVVRQQVCKDGKCQIVENLVPVTTSTGVTSNLNVSPEIVMYSYNSGLVGTTPDTGTVSSTNATGGQCNWKFGQPIRNLLRHIKTNRATRKGNAGATSGGCAACGN